MNRRDTFKAALGGLLGMLGVKAVKATRTVGCLEFSLSADTSKIVSEMVKAKRKLELMYLETPLTCHGAASARFHCDAGQVVTVYGRGDGQPIERGKTIITIYHMGQWHIVSAEC